MPLGLVAIRPKRFDIVNIDRPALERANRQYALDIGKKMADYPPQRPSTYRRTGDYGRGWFAPGSIKASASEVTLVNRIPYAVYVGGPKYGGRGKGERQTTDMRKRGWKSISDVARSEKKRYVQLVNKALRGRPG